MGDKMLKLLFLLYFCRGADVSEEYAQYQCEKFYAERNLHGYGIETTFHGEGGQGRVWICATRHPDASIKMEKVALKLYRYPETFNWTEMAMTVSAVEEYDVGPEVYHLDYASEITLRPVVKIEQLVPVFGNGAWREESRDVGENRLDRPSMYRAYGTELAKLHSIPYDALPKRKTFEVNYVKLGPVYQWAAMAHWNTMHVYDYLTQPVFASSKAKLNRILQRTDEEMDREFKWLEKRVRESSGPIVLCHNDPHGSNMRVDGNFMNPDPETYTLIDFDNAEYGYRAWDFSYYFTHLGQWPSIEQQRDLFESYTTQWNKLNDENLSVENLLKEMEEIAPYTIMQEMLFMNLVFGVTPTKLIQSYIDYVVIIRGSFDPLPENWESI